MDTFYDDFTSSLRSCAASRFYTSPLDRWSPQEIAAPERHRWLSEEKGDDEKWDDDAGTLDHQNAAFGLLESMLHIYFDPAEVEPLEGAETSEKEQVWLFAHHWLSLYYNFSSMFIITTVNIFYSVYWHQNCFPHKHNCL